MRLEDVKDAIIDYYVSKASIMYSSSMSHDPQQGLVVKNWREKRSFVALETGAATLMWFSYSSARILDMERGNAWTSGNT